MLVIKYKGSKKKKATKKQTTRCDSEDVSFTRIKKKFVYSINVLESAIKKMKKLVISDENDDDCKEAIALSNANKLNSKNGKALNKVNKSKKNNAPPNATKKGVNKTNTLKNLEPPAPSTYTGPVSSFGCSSTNDICTDYIEISRNIREIISQIDVVLKARDGIVVECIMTEIIFEKFQKSKSNFEEVIEKLNKDQRLSSVLGNGPTLAPNNGTRNKAN